MTTMNGNEWTIQRRAERCAATGEPFRAGEYFYTLLFDDAAGFRREDLSETAWQARAADAPPPFSFWRAKFEPPPPPPAEPLAKESAEDLLRRYMAESSPEHANARYILAVMLERKKMLKEVECRETEQGGRVRIYEHTKTGELFVIPDPQLRLDQVADVQSQIAALLAP
jgi:hypothetical protein